MKHPARSDAQEDGQDGYHIGMDVELIPKQGECQSDRTCEMDIKPLFSIL